MRIPALALVFLILAPFFVPVAAAQGDDLLGNISKITLPFPTKENAPLRSKESMTEMLNWLNALSRSLFTFYQNLINVLGLGDTDYAKQMTQSLEKGLSLSRNVTGQH